jgi:hypothetical protein
MVLHSRRPQDRLGALAPGEALPDGTTGSAAQYALAMRAAMQSACDLGDARAQIDILDNLGAVARSCAPCRRRGP